MILSEEGKWPHIKNANPKMMRACFPEILKFVFRIQSIMPSKIEENRNR